MNNTLDFSKEIRLIEYIESQMVLSFEFGKNDCILFVAGAIDAMQGTELREKYAGLWKTQKDVDKYTENNKSVSEVLHDLNYEPVELNYIQTGDILIMEQQDINLRTYGVFTGSKVALFTDKGLILLSISETKEIVEVLRCHQ